MLQNYVTFVARIMWTHTRTQTHHIYHICTQYENIMKEGLWLLYILFLVYTILNQIIGNKMFRTLLKKG